MFALYEGGSGNPATANDCAGYADTIGNPSFPVFADGSFQIVGTTPMTQLSHPELCALSPEMEILSCHVGHNSYMDALDTIRSDAGL